MGGGGDEYDDMVEEDDAGLEEGGEEVRMEFI
jgi:hypothetical protein